MRRGSAALPTLLLLLASGCATQSEDQRSEPADRDYEARDEPTAMEAAASADSEAAPRSLAELERARASNNARLRELGVALPVVEAELEDQTATASKAAEPGGASGAGGLPPSVAPAPDEPSKRPSKTQSSEKKEEKRRDKKDKAAGAIKPTDDAELDWDARPRPEEAKAAPPSSTHELDPATRCQQVCDLAAISCGLGDEICELADRHRDEQDYTSACERANLDCEAAKEACDACAQ